MKDLNVIKEFKEIPITDTGYGFFWRPIHKYSFTKPEGTFYSKIFKYIANEGYASKHEIWENVHKPNFIKHHRRIPVENGYYSTFWQAALKEDYVRKYRHGKHIYYMLTKKGYDLIESSQISDVMMLIEDMQIELDSFQIEMNEIYKKLDVILKNKKKIK